MKAILLILVLAGCASTEPKTDFEKRIERRKAAIDIALLKYLQDDSWTFAEVEKEIRYQEYLAKDK